MYPALRGLAFRLLLLPALVSAALIFRQLDVAPSAKRLLLTVLHATLGQGRLGSEPSFVHQ